MGYVHTAYADQYRRGHTALGTHPDTGDTLFITDVDRNSGMYVPGQAGMGKSSFLETIALQDIEKGNALVFIDPHGDSVQNIISYAAQQYMSRIFLLDLTDEAYPFGVNPFASAPFSTSADKSKSIARITNIFRVLWPNVLEQANTPIYLQAAITTLLSNPNSTIVDMLRLFSMKPEDIAWRHKMLEKVTTPDVLDHWDEYEHGTKNSRNEASALIRRLKLLFMGRELVAAIVGQRQTSINFRRAIEDRQIILVKLPVNEFDEDAQIVGTLLMSELTHALFSFGDTERSQRPGVSIIIDECQNFTTPDVERLIQQGRKYGARLVLAHQARGQLDKTPFLKDVTMGCRTKVVLRPNPKDVNELAPLFHDTTTTIKPEDTSNNAVHELQVMGSDLPFPVQVFVETYLRGIKATGDIPVKKGLEPSLRDYLTKGYAVPKKTLPSPVSSLNDLFRSVMRSGNPRLPIPENAIVGLANGGMGFYVESWFGAHDARWLTRDLSEFPKHFVGQDGDGWRWKRRPEDEREQFLHCVFHLRMTMQFLAEHPLGKATNNSSNVAQLLSHLPIRHAFVHASDGVWYMRTLDTPPAVDAENLNARLHFIREQTRQTYCHPRSQVEAKPMSTEQPEALTSAPAMSTESPVHSRWEDE